MRIEMCMHCKEMNPKIKIYKYLFRFQLGIREAGLVVLERKNEIQRTGRHFSNKRNIRS